MFIYFLSLLSTLLSVCLSLCVSLSHMEYIWKSEDSFQDSVLPFHIQAFEPMGTFSFSQHRPAAVAAYAPFHRPDANLKPDGSITKDKQSATLPILQRTESELHRSSENKEEFTLNPQQREGRDYGWGLSFRNGLNSVS